MSRRSHQLLTGEFTLNHHCSGSVHILSKWNISSAGGNKKLSAYFYSKLSPGQAGVCLTGLSVSLMGVKL